MNELDRQIAELKGMKAPESLEGLEIIDLIGGAYSWSTSDAKAFELVDELAKDSDYRLYNFFFKLERMENGQGWKAVFTTDLRGKMIAPKKYTSQSKTRPEAICRAYITAMEYMRGKR